jgi:hypothetical protein
VGGWWEWWRWWVGMVGMVVVAVAAAAAAAAAVVAVAVVSRGPWRTHHHSHHELKLVDALAFFFARFFVKRHDLLALGRVGDDLGLLELPFA